jgi:hypothetical protein
MCNIKFVIVHILIQDNDKLITPITILNCEAPLKFSDLAQFLKRFCLVTDGKCYFDFEGPPSKMIEWKKEEKRFNIHTLRDQNTLLALWDCGFLKFFRIQDMRSQTMLLDFLAMFLDSDQQ